MQNCYDPAVYNIENRGLSTEASLGSAGSQTLYGLIVGMSQTLPIVITSIYGYLYISSNSIECIYLINEILSPDKNSICSNPQLTWQVDSDGLALWILTYWNDVNSTYWLNFQNISTLSNEDMLTLFNTTNNLTELFGGFDYYIKQWYDCPNPGNQCDPMYLAKIQWGQSYVTKHLPPSFKTLSIGNSSSITNYQYLSMGLTGTPEYYAFAEKYGCNGLNISQINTILSFNGLLGQTYFQLFFIYEYRGNYTGLREEFNLPFPQIMTKYLRYMVDLYLFGGLIKSKSVNTILWDDQDPLLVQSLNLNPLLGGNPATVLSSTSIAGNMTQDEFKTRGKKFRDGMDSGETHVKNVRRYRKYGGVSYINLPTLGYFGEGKDGPNIGYYNNNPWAIEIPMDGTDAWGFRPYMSKNDKIKFFFDVAGLIFDGKYVKETTVREFDCLRFGIDKNILQNATTIPGNAIYYSFGPNGIINQTNVFQAPLFGSKPYFLNGDPMLNRLVNYTEKSLAVPSNYESVFDIEKFTGTVLHAMEQIQYNTELKPDNLYPNLGLESLKKYGYRTYMPMFFLQRSETLTQHIVNELFGMIHTILTVILVAQIVGYVLAGILFIIVCVYIWKRHRKLKVEYNAESERGQSLMIGNH